MSSERTNLMTKRRLIIAGAIIVASVWALRPVERDRTPQLPQSPTVPTADPSTQSLSASLDLVAFQTPLWVAPPAPPPAPPPTPAPPPPAPLRLQLLAIIKSGDDANGRSAGASGSPSSATYSAMFYDPDANKVIVLAEGDTLPGAGGRTIAKITALDIQIREPRTAGGGGGRDAVTTLTIRPGGGGGGEPTKGGGG
ncbi:MAG: hypothetical protein AB7O77_15930 [Phycisphaerales bacterium]